LYLADILVTTRKGHLIKGAKVVNNSLSATGRIEEKHLKMWTKNHKRNIFLKFQLKKEALTKFWHGIGIIPVAIAKKGLVY